MKKWSTPVLETLNIEETAQGNGSITTPDDSYVDGNNKWYSFPDDPNFQS